MKLELYFKGLDIETFKKVIFVFFNFLSENKVPSSHLFNDSENEGAKYFEELEEMKEVIEPYFRKHSQPKESD